MTPKLREKEGLVFKEAPDFYKLTSDSRQMSDGYGSIKSMDDIKEDYKSEEDKNKKRKENKKNAPSIKELREYKRKLIAVHAKDVEISFPSSYPILGKSEDSDESKSSGGDVSNKSSSSSTSSKTNNTRKRKAATGNDTNTRASKRRK